MTPARLRPRAEADLVEQSRYYLVHAGDDIAARFFDAAMNVLQAVERMPGTGTPLIGELAHIPDIRLGRVPGLPCGWFYFVREDHLDVVRLLADSQDLAAILDIIDDE